MKEIDFKFYYKELLPNSEIAHLVKGFFEFSINSDSPKPIPHEVFPDGCISLLFRRNKNINLEIFLIKGLSLETFHTEVLNGDIHWGLKISPAACSKVLRCDPNKIQTQPVFDDSVLPHLLGDITEKLADCENFEQAVEVYENSLKELNISKDDIDTEVIKAVKIIESNKGELKIAELTDELEISRRQLERRFKSCTGLTPKQFARTYRLRATAISLLEKDMKWANRAAEMGFADQSHLSHELENLTGRTPKSFKERIEYVDHEDLIK